MFSMCAHGLSASLTRAMIPGRTSLMSRHSSTPEESASCMLCAGAASTPRTAHTHAIAAATLFEDDAIASATSKPQVILLLDALDEAANSAVASLSTEVDQLVVDGREVHWLPVGGVGRAALDLDGLARITGPTTVRTAGTIQRMAAKFLAG